MKSSAGLLSMNASIERKALRSFPRARSSASEQGGKELQEDSSPVSNPVPRRASTAFLLIWPQQRKNVQV